jgi:hypothetical protein
VELMEDASVQAGIGGTPAGLRSPRFAELDTQIQAEAEQRQNRPTAKRSPRNRGEAEAFMLVPSIGGLERKVADLGDIRLSSLDARLEMAGHSASGFAPGSVQHLAEPKLACHIRCPEPL